MILTIQGQLRGGKNSIIVTRSGHRIPKKLFADFRDDAVRQILEQTKGKMPMWDYDMMIHVKYTPGDRRKRDVPALIDGLFHVLERSGIVKDDFLLQQVTWTSVPMDRKNPQTWMKIERYKS